MSIKKITVSITGAITGAIVLFQGLGFTQEVPKLKQGLPYCEARELLINEGWQAIDIPILQRDGQLSSAVAYIVKDLGYNEVADCSGTGLGLCRFEFVAADGRKLIVVTVDNDPRAKEPVILHRWWIEKG
jgi:hypothetical protein